MSPIHTASDSFCLNLILRYYTLNITNFIQNESWIFNLSLIIKFLKKIGT